MDLPLVLGGTSPLTLFGWTDASLGTGPRRRSVLGNISVFGPNSGAVQAKALKGEFKLEHIKGTEIPAGKLTKLGNVTEHQQFTRQTLGLTLLDSTDPPVPPAALPNLGSISPNLAEISN